MKEKSHHHTHGFPPVIHPTSEVLILGSFPSVKSRKDAFYYMHPRNRFWKILSEVFDDDDFESPSPNHKKMALKRHRLALYDAIEACAIEGSKDASITHEKPTDVKALIEGTKINRIVLNGQKAATIFKRHNPDLIPMSVTFPSTSPANAAYRFEDLLAHWESLKTHNPDQ